MERSGEEGKAERRCGSSRETNLKSELGSELENPELQAKKSNKNLNV